MRSVRGTIGLDPTDRWRRGTALVMPTIVLYPLLFIPQLGLLGPVFFLIAVALTLVPVTMSPADRIMRAWPVFAIPAFAIASTLWSVAPSTTLRYSIQLLLTMLAGIMIGTSSHQRSTLWGVGWAMGLYTVFSLAFGSSVGWGAGQETAFAGLNGGKNYLGDIVAISMLATLPCTMLAVRSRNPLLIAATLAMLAAEGYTLVLSRSSGAILGIALGSGVFLAILALGSTRYGLKALLIASLLVGIATLGSGVAMEGQAIRSELLRAMGKDDTLTGRVYLWYRSEAIMRQRPLLGTGYGAFWVQGQPDAEGLWAYSEIAARLGFNFHNTPIELRVNMGWIGFLLIAAIALACTGILIVTCLFQPTLPGAFWAAFMVYEVSRTGYEAIGPTPFNFGTVLMAAALSFATNAIRQRRDGDVQG